MPLPSLEQQASHDENNDEPDSETGTTSRIIILGSDGLDVAPKEARHKAKNFKHEL
jgi:hypothetical protein